ncbi:TPA: hypothetical protein OTS01_004485 [Escherichia coli]|nr:hypothetical protein [Escherichia coli]HCT2590359.1 hypothetical protein [Escherichia coli]
MTTLVRRKIPSWLLLFQECDMTGRFKKKDCRIYAAEVKKSWLSSIVIGMDRKTDMAIAFLRSG